MADPVAATGSSVAATEGAPLAILDYGMGNLRSVEKAFARAGATAVVTANDAEIVAAPGLVLPGVGAFPRAMARIRERGWDRLLRERVAAGAPVLGICLGHQLIFEHSDELGGAEGLGLLGGPVRRLAAPGLKVPHIGWAELSLRSDSPLMDGIPDRTAFYFVHSFAPQPAAVEDILGEAVYGERFVAAVARGNVFGVQFHPEKSSAAGLRLLANFARLCVDKVAA